MSISAGPDTASERTVDWPGLVREIGPRFAERAIACDASDHLVAENFAELKTRGAFAATPPVDRLVQNVNRGLGFQS
jgi:hypothetical protein